MTTTLPDALVHSISILDSIVGWGMGLATTLVGLGAAFIIGRRDMYLNTQLANFALLLSLIFFVQSAAYGVWWRFEMASAWYQDCLRFVVGPRMRSQFNLHLIFFVLGLVSLAIPTSEAFLRRMNGPQK